MQGNPGDDKIRRLREAVYSRAKADKMRPRERRELDELASDVPSDWNYSENAKEAAAMQTAPRAITITRRALWWLLGIAAAFFIVSAGVFVYYFTVGPGGGITASRNIDITVQGPISVVGGEPAEFQVTITNRNRVPLELADLVITYPPGTRSPADFATDLTTHRESLGTIGPGEQRQGTVSAVLIGQEGTEAQMHVELEYRVENSNAIFVADTDYQVTFSASPIAVAVEANDEVIAGQPTAFAVTVSSNADTVVKDVLLTAEYPFGFTMESSDPEVVAGTRTWELGDIYPGDRKNIRIEGIMEGQETEERVFTFVIGTREEADMTNVTAQLAEAVHRVAIARPFVGLSINVNQEGGEATSVVRPGELVTVQIPWQNNLATAISDLVLVAKFEGVDVIGSSVRAGNGFYRSSDRTVLWDKSTTNGQFSSIAPGERGVVTVSFQMPSDTQLLNQSDAELRISINAAARRNATGVPQALQTAVSRSVKVESSVQFIARGFYYSNPFGSVGPLPPKANEETTYAVVWTLVNTANRVTDGVVSATLPPNVRWLGQYSPRSEESVTYYPSEGRIEWRVGELAAGTGFAGSQTRQVVFPLGLTPSANQVGQEPNLLMNQTFTGTDAFTETTITETHPNTTTDLLDDPGFASSDATVVE